MKVAKTKIVKKCLIYFKSLFASSYYINQLMDHKISLRSFPNSSRLTQANSISRVQLTTPIQPTQSSNSFSSILTKKSTLIVFLALAGAGLLTYGLIKLIKSYLQQKEPDKEKTIFQEHKSEYLERLKDYNDEFSGVIGVFAYPFDDNGKLQRGKFNKFFKPLGLPNIGNTCYMNALLQSLTGSSVFMRYVERLWMNVRLDVEDKNSLITFRLLELLQNLSKGATETSPSELYNLLCNSDFTQHAEQQDSHELLHFLQDNITKMTAKHLRMFSTDLGLADDQLAASSNKLPRISTQCSEHSSLHSQEEAKNEENHINGTENISLAKSLSLSQYSNGEFIKDQINFRDLTLTKRIGMNPLAGVYLSTISCFKCGPKDAIHRWEISYDLSLDIQPTLQQSINSYFRGEQIEDYICIKCSLRKFLERYPKDTQQIGDVDTRQAVEFMKKLQTTHNLDEELFVEKWKQFKKETGNSCQLGIEKLTTRITKRFSLSTPPKIMCFHLKRVYYNNQGQLCLNQQFIKFPEILDLSKIPQLLSNGNPVDIKYQLCGVIEHFGTPMGGHYVAYRPLFPLENLASDKWVLCDDSNISIISKEQVLTRNAYMLIYQRIINEY